MGKAQKAINFDKIVLQKLEAKAKSEGTSVSNLVNTLCRQCILSDIQYFTEMSKMHYLKFQEFQFMKSQAEAIQITTQ